jgi:hypothetical protein
MMKQFTLCSLSIQRTCNTYGSHVGNLKPKIGHKDINKFSHEHVALMPSTILVT